MKNSMRSNSAINPVAMENMGDILIIIANTAPRKPRCAIANRHLALSAKEMKD